MGSFHRWAVVLASLALAFLGTTRSFAQYNTNGFIRTDGWNMLFLDQAYGSELTTGIAYPGGGPVFQRANWVAPHDIGLENPKAGDVWADISFVTVPTPGPRAWTLTSLGPSPLWVSYSSLGPLADAALPAPVALPAIGDIVDFQTLVDRIRQFSDPDLAAAVTDNAVAISTTYVRNTTGADMYVQIGSGSDDSIRVLVNDLEVHVKSVGRGVPGINPHNPATFSADFEDFGGAVLPPGISKITALVWEGGGGWALRLGVIRNGALLKDGNGLVEFLGTGAGDPLIVGQDMPPDAFAFKNVNPFGWILTKGWNFLGPLDQRFGNAGGGPQHMLRNWTYPRDIGTEDPKANDVWDVDFLQAGTQGFAARDFAVAVGLGDKPRWFTYQGLNDLVAPAPGAAAILPLPGSGEGRAPYGRGDINFDDMFRFLNARILRPNMFPPIDLKNCLNPADFNADCDPDQYIMLATTYVRNKTGADLPVQVITGSDDSCQVWVNCTLVTNSSFNRGVSVFGSELREAVLPPGISKIAFVLVEANGGSGFRLGLRPVGSLYNYTDGDPAIEFLGHGSGDPTIVAGDHFCLERLVSDPDYRCFDTATVTLKGNGAGSAGDPIEVVERISAFDLEAADITDVSHGGVVTETVAAGVYKNVSSTGGDIWNVCDSFEFDYAVLTGDFDVSIELIHRNYSGDETVGGAGKVGLMARETLANNSQYQMIQDFGPNTNDGARTARRRASLPLQGGSAPCGNVREDATLGDGNALRHPRFMRIKRIGQVITTWVSNLPGLADGTLSSTLDANWSLHLSDNWDAASNGATAANPLPADLFVGFANSEHGGFFADVQMAVYRILPGSNAGGTPVDAWTTSVLVGSDGGGKSGTTLGDAVIGKFITWNTTRGAANEGLTYKLTYDNPGRVTFPPPRSAVFATNVPRVLGGPPINARLDSYALNFFPDQSGPVGDLENSHDIGFINDPRTPGSTVYDETTDSYTVKGSGTDIWDNGDRMHFAYKKVSGDFTATARITNIVNPPNARWGRSGVMARYTCDHNSKYSMAVVPYRGELPAESDAKRHQSRRDHLVNGNGREQQVLPSGLLTQGVLGWVRLTRMGGVMSSHFADDVAGQPGTWQFAGSDYDAQRPEELLVGLAASSHSSGNPFGVNPLEVRYDNWSVVPLSAPETACTASGEPVTLNFSAPLDSATSLVVLGAGTFTPAAIDGRLRLAQHLTADTATAVWFSMDGKLLGDKGFKAEFDAYISKTEGVDPADGFTFAAVEGLFATATGLVGGGGGGLGYNRGDHNAVPTNSRRKSFAVEIDTWDGGNGDNDPLQKGVNVGLDSTYHMAVDVNFDVQSSQNNVEFGQPVLPSLYFTPGGIFTADQGIHVEVTYDPADRVSNTSLVEVFVKANNSPLRRKILSTRSTVLSGDVFLGFTAGTGNANGTFEIDNVVVQPNCCEEPDRPVIAAQEDVNLATQDVVTLDGSGSTGADGTGMYEWEILSGNAEIMGPADVAMPQVQLTGTGDVRAGLRFFDGACEETTTAEVEFSVTCDEPAEVAAIVVPPGPHEEGSTVTLDSAGSSAGARTWSIVSGPGEIVGGTGGETVQVRGTDAGFVVVRLVVDDGICDNSDSAEAEVTFGSGVNWKRCDSNGDAALDMSDSVHTLNYLFLGGEASECLASSDCNVDEFLDISDPLYALNVLFLGLGLPEFWDTCEKFGDCPSSCEE